MGLLITKVPDKETGKYRGIKLLTLVFLCFLISIIAYYPYFENGWYALDDYITLSLSGTGSFTGMSKAITDWLYSAQGRFQPVRLSIFIFLSRLFGEEQSVFYNFALHLINLLLLFYVLLKFRINHLLIFLTVLSFSVFGRWRSMESSSTMIGGSGLNLFFILTSILFLIKSSESKGDVKKYFYYALSIISYFLLTFSYEVAFPLFLPVFMALYFFSDKENGGRLKPFLKSIPYLAILLFYLMVFKLPAKGAYEGSSIQISPEILIRFKSYLLHTPIPPMQINSPLKEGFVGLVFLALYYFTVYICLKGKKDIAFHDREESLKLLLFGMVFYFSSMILFCLNRWETPRSVMPHHIYLITAGRLRRLHVRSL